MSFELSEDHESLRELVREYAQGEIAPHIAKWDQAHHFPVDVVRGLGDLGLFGLTVPEEYGGTFGPDGSDFTSLCVAIEELGRVDQSIGITLSAGVGLGINPILTYGTDEQKQTYLPDLVAGRALAAFGLTEPEAGSDAGSTKTRARLDGDEWVIDGAKAFITNSGTDITSVVTVTARTGEDEISTILIPSRDSRIHRRPAVREARLAHLRHPRPDLRRLPGAGRRTCWASAVAVMPSSWRLWTTAGSPSRPWRSGSPRRAWPNARRTPGSGRASERRSVRARVSRSRSATSRSPSRRRDC